MKIYDVTEITIIVKVTFSARVQKDLVFELKLDSDDNLD